jgi:hypothetical protein
VLKARQQLGGRLRLALVDTARLAPEFDRIESRVRNEQGGRADTLTNILLRNEASRLLAAASLEVVAPGSRLAARILALRAEAGNLLGDFGARLADAEAALGIVADDESAREARAVALLGLGRPEEALAVFMALRDTVRHIAASKWVGALHFALGRETEAQSTSTRSSIASGPARPTPRARVHPADRAGRYDDAYMVNWVQRLPRHPRPHLRPALRAGLPARPGRGENLAKPEPVAICRLKRVAADNKGDVCARMMPRPPRPTASASPASAPGRRR